MTFRAVTKQKAVNDDGVEFFFVDRFTARYVFNGRKININHSSYKDKTNQFGIFLHVPTQLAWTDEQILTSAERDEVIENIRAAMGVLDTPCRVLEPDYDHV